MKNQAKAMSGSEKLNAQAVYTCLIDLPAWQLSEDGLTIAREYRFAGFVQAFGFMTQVALLAQQYDHHPQWRNVYNRVHVCWTTHDVGGLTQKDFMLAALCDQIAGQGSKQTQALLIQKSAMCCKE